MFEDVVVGTGNGKRPQGLHRAQVYEVTRNRR